MKAPLRFDESDVAVVAKGDLCLIGCGPRTNEAAIFHALRKLANGTNKKMHDDNAFTRFITDASSSPFRRVAVVRDLFDRDEVLRPHLGSVLKVVHEDEDDPTSVAFVVARSVAGPDSLRRRLVNEYVLIQEESQQQHSKQQQPVYRLARAGVELVDYLQHCLHHPVLLADDNELLTPRRSWVDAIVAAASVAGKAKEATETRPRLRPTGRVWDTSRAAAASRTTNTILMVAPVGFQLNEETAQDNHFMHRPAEAALNTERQALVEFSGLHRALTAAGVNIVLYAAERHHNTPDAVFPNNWFSTHPAAETGGPSTLVFYPMKTASRRAERRQTIVEELQAVYEREVSFEHWENADPPRFLESTGVLILDRVRKVAYAALSQRCSKRVASQWAQRMGYTMCFFHASDAQGQPIYHTNVMMAVGSSVAVVCLESVADPEEREGLRRTLSMSHEVVEITRAQVNEFCGNVLEVQGAGGKRVLAMSSRAFAAFTDAQKAVLRRHTDEVVHAPIPTIETVGGGGVRCMMAELF